MNFSMNPLSALTKALSSNPSEMKALIKLASVDVLKSLGDGKYTVMLGDKTLTAQSDKLLSEGAKYWTQFSQIKDTTPKLSNLLKMPPLLQSLQNIPIEYSFKDLSTLLHSKKPEAMMKQNILEHLGTAANKEDFTNLSTLLFSLENHTFTIPLTYNNFYSLLQFKKRYNYKSKKTQIDFYAALELLGPVSGVIALDGGNVSVDLNVAYEKTKNFLENDMKNFSHPLHIALCENIEPLYNTNIHSLLDISI
jgi:hypothetical protein